MLMGTGMICVYCAMLVYRVWRETRPHPVTAPTTHLCSQFPLLSIILACSEVPTTRPALHLFTGKDSGPADIHVHSPIFTSTPSPAPLLLCRSARRCRGGLYRVKGEGGIAHVAQGCLCHYCILVWVIIMQRFWFVR